MEIININTKQREQLIPITNILSDMVKYNGWETGALLVFSPHTTAGITINENADPDVQLDICRFMHKLIPEDMPFRHREGNSDAHIKTSLFGASSLVIVEDGQLKLGIWQDIYFCEWDGPRERKIWVQFLPGVNQ